MSLFDSNALRVARPGTACFPLIGASWYEEQVFDFQVLVDPSDATRLLCYASGMTTPANSTNIKIGRFHAPLSGDLTSWTDDGIVLSPTASTWDATFVRMGSLFYESGTFYMFYSGRSGSGTSIGLATSTNGTTFTKFAGNPILTPTGQGRNDGGHVEEPAVIKEGASWTMIYAYVSGVTLPGYRYATSSDGTTWTKGGAGDILNNEPLFSEFHQILNFGANDYALIYEAGNFSTAYNLFVARSTAVTGPYTNWINNPLLRQASAPVFDRYHIATPFIIQINGQWKLFYCGASDADQPFNTNTWPGSIANIYVGATKSGML